MSFADAAVGFIHHYGYWALFVLMALETAMILHFVPSELIVTVAAATLAHDAWSLAAVVAVSTAGAGTGSLMLYGAARYGGRPFLLRYRRVFHLDERRLDRMEAVFRRPAGEIMVFAFRLLPFLRAFVSIPAGLARMDPWKFMALSMGGAALFNLVLAWTGSRANDPGSLVSRILVGLRDFAESHWLALAVWAAIVLAIAVALWLGWRHRERITHQHRKVLALTWERVALAILGLGVLVLVGAVVAPRQVALVSGWVHGGIDAAEGFESSPSWQFAVLFAVEVLAVGLFVLAAGRFGGRAFHWFEARAKREKKAGPGKRA